MFRLDGGNWILEADLSGHTDWVRDVTWAPNVGIPIHTIVSCSQDRTVLIWKSADGVSWTKKALSKDPFPDTLWRVNFAPNGHILAVAGGDNHITLWREKLDEEWECLSKMDQISLLQK